MEGNISTKNEIKNVTDNIVRNIIYIERYTETNFIVMANERYHLTYLKRNSCVEDTVDTLNMTNELSFLYETEKFNYRISMFLLTTTIKGK